MRASFHRQVRNSVLRIDSFERAARRAAIIIDGNPDMADARIFLQFFAQNRQFRPLAQVSPAVAAMSCRIRIAGLALGTDLHDRISLENLYVKIFA
jgi:hypothetical protein